MLDEWKERRSARKTETINSLAERARKGELEAVKKLVEMSDNGRNEEVVKAFNKAGTLAFSQLVELLADKKLAGTARVLLVLCGEESVFEVENALDELVGLERISGRDVSKLVRLEGVLACIHEDLTTKNAVANAERKALAARARLKAVEVLDAQANARALARLEAGDDLDAIFEPESERGLDVEFEHDEENGMEIAFEPDAEFSDRLERSDKLRERLERSDREKLRSELGVAIGFLGDEDYAKSAFVRLCALAGQEECRPLVLMMLEQAVRTPPNERVRSTAANLLLQLSRCDEEKH